MTTWKFDKEVADRFQKEAKSNIPDYDRVIKLCISIARKKKLQDKLIIDVGSALGYTLNRFIRSGFPCIIGVESSEQMLHSEHNLHRERTILKNTFPTEHKYGMVMANWTLHFIKERKKYIKDIYNSLEDDGVFILTDKTTQSDTIKELYYDFKRSHGVTDEYIYQKEKKLKGYMVVYEPDWYIDTMKKIGFKNIQIINSNLGFVTFYAEK